MKTNILGLLALGVFALTACSDDDVDYTPGTAGTSAHVGFAKSTLTTSATSDKTLAVTLVRTDKNSAKEYAISVSGNDNNVFSVPTTVNFAAGEETATLNVDFNSASAERLVSYPIVLSVGSDDDHNPYYLSGAKMAINLTYEYLWKDTMQMTVNYQFMEQVGNVTLLKADGLDTYKLLGLANAEELYFNVVDGVPLFGKPFYVDDYNGSDILAYEAETAKGVLSDTQISKYGPLNSSVGSDGSFHFELYFYVPDLNGGFGMSPIDLTPAKEKISHLTDDEAARLVALQSEVSALQSLLTNETVKANADIVASVEARLSVASDSVKLLTAKDANLTVSEYDELTSLLKEQADLEERYAEIEEEYGELTAEYAALKAKDETELTDDDKDRIAEIETAISALKAEADGIDTKLSRIEELQSKAYEE